MDLKLAAEDTDFATPQKSQEEEFKQPKKKTAPKRKPAAKRVKKLPDVPSLEKRLYGR